MKLIQKLAVVYLRLRFRLLGSFSSQKAAAKALDLFCTPQERLKKKPSKIFFTAEQLKFNLGELNIRGFRWNHNAGRKVLIIHGFESSIVNFDHYVPSLIKKGLEVLAFDAPAHGISDGKRITAPLFADMIIKIHERYGPITGFVGHSFGGLALSLALEQIAHDETYRAVLIAPATESTTAIDQFFELLQLNGVVRKEFDQLITQIGGHPPEWYSIRRAIRNIKAQILWLHDERDLQTPLSDALKVKNDQRPNVTFVITRGLGHRKIYKDSQTVERVAEFL